MNVLLLEARMQNRLPKVRVQLYQPRLSARLAIPAMCRLLLCESVVVRHHLAICEYDKDQRQEVSPETIITVDLQVRAIASAHVATTVNECKRTTFFVHNKAYRENKPVNQVLYVDQCKTYAERNLCQE